MVVVPGPAPIPSGAAQACADQAEQGGVGVGTAEEQADAARVAHGGDADFEQLEPQRAHVSARQFRPVQPQATDGFQDDLGG